MRLEAGGDVYRFAVYVPADDRAAAALPLVVVVHGCTVTADQQAAASGYDAIAQRARFVVMYPDADSHGCPVAQLRTIHGMGHYWSGGSADRASLRYSDPRGPSAAAGAWAFFSRWRLGDEQNCASDPVRTCC